MTASHTDAATSAPGPTFIGIGGQKCASTWLAECLAAHPEVFVHPKKEIKYWNRLTQEGTPNAESDRPVSWYRDHFVAAETCRGEFTPDYLFDATAASRIAAELGSVKLLCLFRDPVARFTSHLRHCVRRGLLDVDLSQPLDVDAIEAAIAAYRTLKTNGFYFDALGPYLDQFGRDQIHVSIYETLTTDPSELASVFRFLGVDERFEPAMQTKVVGGGFVPRSRLAERSRIATFSLLHKFAPALLPVIRATGVTTLYRRLNAQPTRAVLTPAARSHLESIYAGTAAGLESLGVLRPGLWSCSEAGQLVARAA